MYNISIDLAQRAADTYGIVTNTQLIVDGATHHQIRELVSDDVIIRCHNGVYRVATSPATFESACAAACIADPSIVITGLAAARLWGFRHAGAPTIPIALVEHDRHPMASGVTIRRTNVLTTIHRVQRDDGIAIASPPRTWFDCGRDLNDDRFEAMTEWVLDHYSSMPTLWRTVREMDARGRPGLARVRRVLSQRSTWQRPAGSKLELRVLKALKRAAVPELVRQHPLKLPNGIIIHPDGADPEIRWAIEVDHVTWHGGRIDAQRDKGRDRRLHRIGWQVERVNDQELRDSFSAVIAELADLHATRSREQAA
ncbi:MAG: hypothetical protein ACJAR2_003637 [Ilumatobacter sp.]|jgi:hypothetical protein